MKITPQLVKDLVSPLKILKMATLIAKTKLRDNISIVLMNGKPQRIGFHHSKSYDTSPKEGEFSFFQHKSNLNRKNQLLRNKENKRKYLHDAINLFSLFNNLFNHNIIFKKCKKY